MIFDRQLPMENDEICLSPLTSVHFEQLYAIASDPKIWEQHPNKNRWRKADFSIFFEGALRSGGAYIILCKKTGAVLGSTRFYDYDPLQRHVYIGYTFYSVKCWGTGLNPKVKKMMITYALKSVEKVYFHIGSENVRSQIAISRLGAEKIAEDEVEYYGEPKRLNFLYVINKENWIENYPG